MTDAILLLAALVWWALIMAGVIVGVIVIRAILEELMR